MDKPTEINALEFINGGYVDMIAKNECVVSTYYGQKIRSLTKRAGEDQYMIWPLNDSEVAGFLKPRSILHVEWLHPATPASTPPDAVGAGDAMWAKDGETAADEVRRLSYNVETVSTKWVMLHQHISEALGMEFEPNEDIERYGETIANLQAELADCRAQLAAARALLVEVHRYAPQQEPEVANVARNHAMANSFWATGKLIHAFLSGEGKQS